MSRPIRILHIIDTLNAGGTEKQCVKIIKGTNKDKFEVQMVTFNRNGPLFHDLEKEGIQVNEFRITRGYYTLTSILQILRLARFIRKGEFHIVQTYGFYSTIPGVLAAKIARVPVVLSGKRDMNEMLPRHKVVVEKLFWRFCDRIVVNAKKIRDYLICDEGISREKIELIYNGVDLNYCGKFTQMDYHSKANIIGMIANFRKQKDHSTFLIAAANILKDKPDARFVLVGSGPSQDEIKNLAKRLGINDNITFKGTKIGKELHEILNSFTISVLSSTNEGVPNVILESLALGIPVIANPSGGVPEVIEDGLTGYIVPYKRPDILAEKIIYLIDNKDVAMKLGARGREIVTRAFSTKKMLDSFDDLCSNLVTENLSKL
jgi:glycosyltransferase involved in cell wall biosynthesis